jgi:threonine aldolase
MIDLRSDTVSRPTPAMREAIARAEVGDDVYGDDPSVRALERHVAALLGKEDAVFMPTGTMTNQVALRTHTQAGDEVLMDGGAHMYRMEGAAPAALSGVSVRPLAGRNGIFTAADVQAAIPSRHRFKPVTLPPPVTLLCVENTHNGGGGTIWPLATLREVVAAGREHGLALHLDGARIWHASVATGISEAEYAAPFDSVSVCFSKGLGAPMGSALAGTKAFTDRARRFKQTFGGGFRQAGMMAAGALHAVRHHRERLAEDHRHAARLADALAATSGIVLERETVQTNIVRFRVTGMTATAFVEACHARGVHMLPATADSVRAVLHLDVSSADVERAATVMQAVMSGETVAR